MRIDNNLMKRISFFQLLLTRISQDLRERRIIEKYISELTKKNKVIDFKSAKLQLIENGKILSDKIESIYLENIFSDVKEDLNFTIIAYYDFIAEKIVYHFENLKYKPRFIRTEMDPTSFDLAGIVYESVQKIILDIINEKLKHNYDYSAKEGGDYGLGFSEPTKPCGISVEFMYRI